MIPNSMHRFPPPPDTRPVPVMWKNLGIISQGRDGYVEAHYELETFRGDLDVDSEDEVRNATHTLLAALSEAGKVIDSGSVYVLQRRRGLLRVRLCAGAWGEPTTVTGVT